MRILIDETNINREYFTGENGNFHCQNVYLQGENIYCFLNFTATKTTYDFNIELFDELVENIKLE